MYIINAIEIERKKGDIIQRSNPVEFEYHNDLMNATASLNYFTSIFGKHYRFFIVEHKN